MVTVLMELIWIQVLDFLSVPLLERGFIFAAVLKYEVDNGI